MPRRKGSALTRDDVVGCAIDCIAAEGADALGVNRVARALGIKPPSLYNHVRGNADLREAVAVEGNRRLGEAIDSAPPNPSPVRRIALAYRQWVSENTALYAVMSDTSLDPQSEHFASIMGRLMELFGPIVQGRSERDAIHTIRGIRAALHGFVSLEGTGQFRLSVDADASFQWLVAALERSMVEP